MKKLVGYVISVIGIAIMALGFGIFGIDLETVKPYDNYISAVGIVVIIAGVLISLKSGSSSGKIDQKKEEVPIYEGVGKKRKIVGYRKD